ncbi:MAG: hypothetical protein ACLRSW_06255 [Christensenellaceae bacterium]
MTESRCGLLCSECAYREQMNCKGCVYIQKPFGEKAVRKIVQRSERA